LHCCNERGWRTGIGGLGLVSLAAKLRGVSAILEYCRPGGAAYQMPKTAGGWLVCCRGCDRWVIERVRRRVAFDVMT
jgi:hypothetical protein